MTPDLKTIFDHNVTFPTNAEHASAQVEQVMEKLDEHCAYPDSMWCRLATAEALYNAVEHGNKGDATKNLKLQATLSEVQNDYEQNLHLFISVTDEGTGYDPKDLPDPRVERNLNDPSGRGVLLLDAAVDSFEVKSDESGCNVQMVKRMRSKQKQELDAIGAALFL